MSGHIISCDLFPDVFWPFYGCKFAPTYEVMQILHRVQIVHMNAKCLISIRFNRGFRYIEDPFYDDPV